MQPEGKKLARATAWMNLEDTVLRERERTNTVVPCMRSLEESDP